ncbi:MAG TPA: Asp23/Gls24 family envelope stress response protein [Actinokineospora sp.]|nr:Asp23/Gls24 family envelope stress response protein [Actinokineospora sp.]
MEFGHAVNAVAEQVRVSVIESVEQFLGLDVAGVDVHVTDIHLPDAL